ncbi:MAG TPA: cysteine synthase family protein [Longimicrobiaceae bacterium]|nr:cysteine synthase family protein [Longimicrobiaceae bacterium]
MPVTRSKHEALQELHLRLGQTPLRQLVMYIDGVARAVWVKLESENPSGSIKVRTAFSLVQDLEKRGRLRDDSVLVESTSGNLGLALSLICRELEYGFVAVVDPKAPPEMVERMRELGAEVRVIDQPDAYGNHLASRLRYVEELCRSDRRFVWADQYSSPANPRAHYESTGPEIYQQMHGKVDAVFVAVGTGGTLAGIGRFFQEVSHAIRVIGVDVPGSVVFGGPRAPRHLSGIGSARPSSFLAPGGYHSHMLVSEAEAIALCRLVAQHTRLTVGGSSGAALAACARYLRDHPHSGDVVCICPDGGENYASTIYCDEWLRKVGVDLLATDLAWLTEIRSG